MEYLILDRREQVRYSEYSPDKFRMMLFCSDLGLLQFVNVLMRDVSSRMILCVFWCFFSITILERPSRCAAHSAKGFSQHQRCRPPAVQKVSKSIDNLRVSSDAVLILWMLIKVFEDAMCRTLLGNQAVFNFACSGSSRFLVLVNNTQNSTS